MGAIAYVLLFTASIALGETVLPSASPIAQAVMSAAVEVPVEPNFFSKLLAMVLSAEGLAKLVAFAIALQLFLRGAAEALTRIADYTDTTWDNKAAAWLSEAAWVIGSVLGKFGYGTPKLVAQELKASQPTEAPKA